MAFGLSSLKLMVVFTDHALVPSISFSFILLFCMCMGLSYRTCVCCFLFARNFVSLCVRIDPVSHTLQLMRRDRLIIPPFTNLTLSDLKHPSFTISGSICLSSTTSLTRSYRLQCELVNIIPSALRIILQPGLLSMWLRTPFPRLHGSPCICMHM